MSTLEDKLLGEKREYYCSSSSGSDSEPESGDECSKSNEPAATGAPPLEVSDSGGSANTGPKGVIKDWQRFKQLEVEKRAERERERLELIKKLSLTCKSNLQEEREQEDPEFAELLEDAFLIEYSKHRMQEMFEKATNQPKFGSVVLLNDGQEFLDAVDKENKSATVVIHIYEDKVASCKTMNHCLNQLCKEYPEVKFCKILALTAGVSKHFKTNGVPALLIYKSGNLVGNYVRLSEELGDEFSSSDVENFLIENGMIADKSCVPSLIQKALSQNADDDDDDI